MARIEIRMMNAVARNWARWVAVAGAAAALAVAPAQAREAQAGEAQGGAPTPIEHSVAADWIFAFKLNAASFPTNAPDSKRPCPFGGKPAHNGTFGQAYAAATSLHPRLADGPGLVGTSLDDPVGATFARIWNGNYYYVVWNDQLYQHPLLDCARGKKKNSDDCGAPWGHSKGVLAWNESGEGLVLQVSTPSWPAAGSKAHLRPGEGNTLGCISHPNNLKFSQHFFALRLNESDVENVLDALANANVVTDPANPVLVRNGGPAAIRAKVAKLGVKTSGRTVLDFTLSTHVRLISKPSALLAPPWQLVSATLGGVPLRVASWWADPGKIYSTTGKVTCWDSALADPGPVEIAMTGHWDGREIDLKGSSGNHAKVGVSTGGPHPYVIFGDMNQQGAAFGSCRHAQNMRGGLFFVVENADLHDSVQALIQGQTAGTAP